MYVCVCRAVRERQIREAAAEGVTTLRELQQATGLGTGCGKCVPSARACLDEALRHSRVMQNVVPAAARLSAI